jgi:REP element-mobilizing transposase RayT
MAINILVVTNSPAVADTIHSSLDETGPFRVHLVNNKASAVVKTDEESCSVAMLDLDLGEHWVSDIGQALRTINSSIKLIVLCEDETPPALDVIRPWTLLRKPFHLRELIHSIDKSSADPKPMENTTSELPWLQDVSKAAQYLTRLTLESSAQAALITHRNSLWAYAGGLSQSAGNEVAQTVSRNWDDQKGSDLLRFIRLESTRAEHMLYATRLAPDLILALVFDAETPFSTIRSQANQLINTLNDVDEKPVRPSVVPTPAAAPSIPAASAPSGPSKFSKLISSVREAEMEMDGVEDPDLEPEEDDEFVVPSISNILNNIPSPNPGSPSKAENVPVEKDDGPAPVKFPSTPVTALGETRPSAPLSNLTTFRRDNSASLPVKEFLVAEQPNDPGQTFEASDEVDVTSPSRIQRPETPIRAPYHKEDSEPDELGETRPSPSTEAGSRAVLEPIAAGMYHLAYACLLVPRFTSHYLTGDLADRLAEWLPKICIAFGWRLEFLAVRPTYLQWVVNVQPNTSPGYLMRVMRQHMSEKIFGEFPPVKKENPSGDFWAPGYLIMGGAQPHPPQLVKDYIKQTRERQGISRPPRSS